MEEYGITLIEELFQLQFPDKIKEILEREIKQVIFKKGTYVVTEGSMSCEMYLIQKGIVRGCYLDIEGNERTKCFSFENQLFGTECFLTGSQATYSVECIEKVLCLKIPYELAKRLEENSIIQRRMQQIIIEDYNRITRRNREMLLCDAKERYQKFLEEYPMLESRIKQKYIASYLGINPVSLSRLKNENN